jgi:hypothetical protein
VPVADDGAVITLADTLGEEDPPLDHMLGMHAVAAHWAELPPREQQILIMDFRAGLTQVQIAERLRISQMHVSRLRTHALGHLRARLLTEPRPVPRQHVGRRATMTTAGAERLPGRVSCVRPLPRAAGPVTRGGAPGLGGVPSGSRWAGIRSVTMRRQPPSRS